MTTIQHLTENYHSINTKIELLQKRATEILDLNSSELIELQKIINQYILENEQLKIRINNIVKDATVMLTETNAPTSVINNIETKYYIE